MTRSFQGRFLVVAAVLGIALLAMVIYTQKLVHDDSRESKILISEYKAAEKDIVQINDLYLGLKSSLYQYTLLLTPELKTETLQTIKTLRERCDLFKQSTIVNRYAVIRKYTAELEIVVRELRGEVDKILKLQQSAVTRYPAVKILLDELQPYNRNFSKHISKALDEASDLDQTEKIINTLNQIRYYWEKRVSQVRLFVANRSGTFGAPETVLPQNINSVDIFTERLDSLLDEARDLSHDMDRLIVLPEALDEMIITSRRYSLAFKHAVSLFMKPGWRADVYYLESRIEPLIKQNQDLLQHIEQALSDQIGQMVKNSVETSGTVSSYIWWFVTFGYFLIMVAYFAFEKSIRQPLYQVAMALEAQGNNEKYTIEPKNYYVSESEVLIDAFKNMKEQVDSRQLRLQSILHNVSEGIVISDSKGIVETFNPAAERLFGFGHEDVVGQPVDVLLGYNDNISSESWFALMAGKSGPLNDSSEVRLSRHDGNVFYVSVSTSSMIHQGETYYIAVLVDVSERKALMDSLQNLADVDSLTALYNRRYFTEELERLVERSLRRKVFECAVLFLDLDNFKYINDSHGHHAGDRILIEVSTLLNDNVRKSDLLARLGGDEFAIILYDVDRHHAKDIAEKYQALISNYVFYEKGKVLDVGCTVGIAMMDQGIKGKDDFLMRADYACQLAKQLGRNRVYQYSQEDNQSQEQLLGHIGVAQKIRNAIRENSFRLDFQPIRSTSSDHVYCYEVLLRMIGESGNNIMPFGFLPSAERFDLMIDIDRWVVKNAIELLAKYQCVDPALKISINLSAQSIGDFEIINVIEAALSDNNVSANSLIFEITESVAISHMETACQLLQHLRNMGCRTALDDFGAGYASYAYLKDLPADFVKIDGAFVKDMDENELNHAMVKSMHEIAHIMGKKTIAEFVENEAVLNLLKNLGVDYVQGSYLGEPADKPIANYQATIVPIR